MTHDIARATNLVHILKENAISLYKWYKGIVFLFYYCSDDKSIIFWSSGNLKHCGVE
jgi:hypothetical protein